MVEPSWPQMLWPILQQLQGTAKITFSQAGATDLEREVFGSLTRSLHNNVRSTINMKRRKLAIRNIGI